MNFDLESIQEMWEKDAKIDREGGQKDVRKAPVTPHTPKIASKTWG